MDVEELLPMHVQVRVKEREKKRPMRGEDGGGDEGNKEVESSGGRKRCH